MSDTSRHRAGDSADLSGALSEGPLVTEGPGLLVMDVDSTLIEQEVIELIAERAKALGIETVVFDRGGNK